MDRLCAVDAAFRPLTMALNRRRFGTYLMTYMHMYTVVYCRETERCVVVRVCRWFWMAVRFVCVIRVPVCVPASPGVFLDTVPIRKFTRERKPFTRRSHFPRVA